MGDLEINAWVEAASSYALLRRRYRRCILGFLALGVFGVPLLAFQDKLHPIVRGILITLVFFGSFACWAGGVVTEFGLRRFRCPRCSERFNVTWWSTHATNWCKHCKFYLDPAAIKTAKARVAVDLLE